MWFSHSYLTNSHFTAINNIIRHHDTTTKLREDVNQLLYSHFQYWSRKRAFQFKQFHNYKCRHIPLNELTIYSYIGLMEGIGNYRGIPLDKINNKTIHSAYFIHYINFHVTGYLYKGMTELQPIGLHYPKGVKIKKRLDFKKQNCIELAYDREWIFDKVRGNVYFNSVESVDDMYNYESILGKIERMTPINKRIIRYMCGDLHRKSVGETRIKTKREVARFMGLSEETIRTRLLEIRNEFIS